jgi:hypothetical protein
LAKSLLGDCHCRVAARSTLRSFVCAIGFLALTGVASSA